MTNLPNPGASAGPTVDRSLLQASHVAEMVRAVVRALRASQMYLPNNPMLDRSLVEMGPDEVLKEMWTNPRRGYDPMIVKALINVVGLYPIATVVILDTFEVAVVVEQNPDSEEPGRPIVALLIDRIGVPVPPPGTRINLAERGSSGEYRRTIVKVTNGAKYGFDPTAYFT